MIYRYVKKINASAVLYICTHVQTKTIIKYYYYNYTQLIYYYSIKVLSLRPVYNYRYYLRNTVFFDKK